MAYWLGVAFGAGVTVFLGGVMIETGMLPPWPGMPVGLTRACGALLATAAIVATIYYRRQLARQAEAVGSASGAGRT